MTTETLKHGYALTDRERDVLGLAGRGLSIKGIAQALGISSGTVTWHLKNCYRKYGVSGREQALSQARQRAQIDFVGTTVCTCGRVHTFWGAPPPDMVEARPMQNNFARVA